MKLSKRTHLAAAVLAPILALAPGTLALAQSDPAAAPQAEPEAAPASQELPAAAEAASVPPAETFLVTGTLGAGEAYRVETVNAPGPLGAEKLDLYGASYGTRNRPRTVRTI